MAPTPGRADTGTRHRGCTCSIGQIWPLCSCQRVKRLDYSLMQVSHTQSGEGDRESGELALSEKEKRSMQVANT